MKLEARIKKMERQLGAAQSSGDDLEETLDRAQADFEERAVALAGLTVDELATLAEDEGQPLPWRMDAVARLSQALPEPDGDRYRALLREMEQSEIAGLKQELDSMAPGPDRYFLEHWIRAKEQIRNQQYSSRAATKPLF